MLSGSSLSVLFDSVSSVVGDDVAVAGPHEQRAVDRRERRRAGDLDAVSLGITLPSALAARRIDRDEIGVVDVTSDEKRLSGGSQDRLLPLGLELPVDCPLAPYPERRQRSSPSSASYAVRRPSSPR